MRLTIEVRSHHRNSLLHSCESINCIWYFSSGAQPREPHVSGGGRASSGEWHGGVPGSGDGHQEGDVRVLRVSPSRCAEDIPGLHYSQHALRTHPLHRVGEALVQVRTRLSPTTALPILMTNRCLRTSCSFLLATVSCLEKRIQTKMCLRTRKTRRRRATLVSRLLSRKPSPTELVRVTKRNCSFTSLCVSCEFALVLLF